MATPQINYQPVVGDLILMSGHHWSVMKIQSEGTLDHAFELCPSFVPLDGPEPRFVVPAVMLMALLADGSAALFRNVYAMAGGV